MRKNNIAGNGKIKSQRTAYPLTIGSAPRKTNER